MNARRPRRLGADALVAIAAVAAAATLAAVAAVSARQEPIHAAEVTLIVTDTGGDDDSHTWGAREADRLEEFGAPLVAPSIGPDLPDVPDRVTVGVAADRITIRVEAACAECAVGAARAVLEVAAADLVRRDDAAFHAELREAELALGLPSPAEAVRPHIEDPLPSTPASFEPSDVERLERLRSSALDRLGETRDGETREGETGFGEIVGPTRDQPRVVTDVVQAGIALAAGGACLALLSSRGRPGSDSPRSEEVSDPVPFEATDPPTDPATGGAPGDVGAVAALGLVVVAGLTAAIPVLGIVAPALFVVASGAAAWMLRHDRAGVVSLVLFLWLLEGLAGRLLAFGSESDAGLATAGPVVAGTVVVAIAWWSAPGRFELPATLWWAGLAVAFAAGIGLTENGPRAVLVGAASWAAPAAVAIVGLRTAWRSPVTQAVRRWFLFGPALLAAYGVVQFVVLPSWDAAWLEGASVTSFGAARPLEVRVFSTLSSPAALGFFSAAALVHTVSLPAPTRRWFHVVSAAVPLALSLHRSSWIAAAVGLLVVAVSQRHRGMRRTIPWIAAAGLVAAAVPTVRRRVADSWADGLGDGSLVERVELHRDVVARLVLDPVGHGFGATGAAARATGRIVEVYDSTLLDLLATFGGPVGIAVAAALVMAARRIPRTPSLALSATIAVAAPFANVLEETQGVVVWAVAALALPIATATTTSEPVA